MKIRTFVTDTPYGRFTTRGVFRSYTHAVVGEGVNGEVGVFRWARDLPGAEKAAEDFKHGWGLKVLGVYDCREES